MRQKTAHEERRVSSKLTIDDLRDNQEVTGVTALSSRDNRKLSVVARRNASAITANSKGPLPPLR